MSALKLKQCITSFLFILIIFKSFLFSACSRPNEYHNPFVVEKDGTGQDRTLTYRLGHALEMAEQKYGKRDTSWTILGIEFHQRKIPKLWFPGIKPGTKPRINEGKKQIIIQLTENSVNNEKRALFQLAHEVIHILSPQVGRDTASVFEEGLAVYFSVQYLKAIHLDAPPEYYKTSKSYSAAYHEIEALYKSYTNVDEKIKHLRKQANGLTGITAEQFKNTFPGLSETKCQYLSSNFSQSQ